MRLIFALPLVTLAGCDMTTDRGNDQVTLQYNEQAASQAAEDVGNTAQGIGAAIANEAEETADRVNNSGIVADGNDGGNPAANQQ